MTRRDEIRERRRRKKQKQRLTLVLILSGVALIITSILIVTTVRQRVIETSVLTAKGNALGDPSSPVVIHEFTDFGCGHCGNFAAETAPQIIAEYVETGQVYIVYHSVGSMLSPLSALAAEAVYCAGDQEKFWEYHDTLFENQSALYSNSDLGFTTTLKTYAQDLGLDMNLFNTCFDQGEQKERVTNDQLYAQQSGIHSTPSFLVNGTLYVGALPYEQFKNLIDAEFAKVGN